MAFTGDTSALTRLANKIRDLTGLSSRVARQVSADLETAVQGQFDSGTDPYGQPWEPLSEATVAKGRTPPPLTDTGAMRDSLVVRPTSASRVEITLDHPARPHQTGWSGPRGSGPARPIVPQGTNLPTGWREIIQAAFKAEIERLK